MTLTSHRTLHTPSSYHVGYLSVPSTRRNPWSDGNRSYPAFLFGIETLQTFNYYRRFREDSKILKATAITIVPYLHKHRAKGSGRCLELVNTICGLNAIYSMTVTFYGHAPSQHILNPPHTLNMTILLSAPINALVQLFFGNRTRVLSGHWHIMVLCLFLTLLRFICNVALTIAFWASPSGFSVLRSSDHWEMITASSVGPAVDGLIAVSMCFCLWRLRRSGVKRTQRMGDTLIVWTVETTLIT
ncbi:hypothetical protein B0H16DRAFT_1705392, partial [Mycena metata]